MQKNACGSYNKEKKNIFLLSKLRKTLIELEAKEESKEKWWWDDLKAKEERKSNGGQNTDSGKKGLSVEVERGSNSVKQQKGVDDHQEPWLSWFESTTFGGEFKLRWRRGLGKMLRRCERAGN